VTEARSTPVTRATDGVAAARRVPAWLLVVMIAAIGLNLRAPIGSIPPLLTPITDELRLNSTMQGMLTSVGIVFMGLCAPLGHRLAARFGSELTTGIFLAVLAVGGLLRLAATTPAVLLVSIAVGGVAMGAISALLPGLIAHHLPRIKGLTTGIYSTGLALGVAAAAALAVPSAAWLGGWRPALAVWGVAAAVVGVGWAVLLPRLRHGARHVLHLEPDESETSRGLPWRSRTAWFVTVFSSAQMVVGFSAIAWITPFYVALGRSPADAAALLVTLQVVQLLAMLTLPTLTDFTRDRRPLLLLTVAATSVGVLLLVVAPSSSALPAVLLLGFGLGGGSTLLLVLVPDYTRGQVQAARLGAMTLMVAFLLGAAGPVLLGVLHDATGSYTPGFVVLLGIAVATVAVVPVLRPGRLVD
jgi:CP family cyanate transporter-like MFS transporter